MKLFGRKLSRIILITGIGMILLGGGLTNNGYSQVPPPPPPPNGGTNNGHNLGGNQGVPGAPVGGGMEILLVLGLIYAGKKAAPGLMHKGSESDD